MKAGDRVRVDLAGYGTVRAAESGEKRISVTLDGFGWIAVPSESVTNVAAQEGDTVVDLHVLRALPKGAIVAAGNAVNVAQGDGTFTMILHGTVEIHTFESWMLHRPCRLIHMPVPE